jgi:hypothetical protein
MSYNCWTFVGLSWFVLGPSVLKSFKTRLLFISVAHHANHIRDAFRQRRRPLQRTSHSQLRQSFVSSHAAQYQFNHRSHLTPPPPPPPPPSLTCAQYRLRQSSNRCRVSSPPPSLFLPAFRRPTSRRGGAVRAASRAARTRRPARKRQTQTEKQIAHIRRWQTNDVAVWLSCCSCNAGCAPIASTIRASRATTAAVSRNITYIENENRIRNSQRTPPLDRHIRSPPPPPIASERCQAIVAECTLSPFVRDGSAELCGDTPPPPTAVNR